MVKVCKFGGTSMSNKKAILQSAAIIQKEKERRFVVVSAPGKRNSHDMKVTDLLYAAYNEKVNFGKCGLAFSQIRERFSEIVAELGLQLDINKYLDEVENGINVSINKDYAASRGEYLSAIIMAKLLGYKLVDAKDIIKFRADGTFDSEYTNDLVASLKDSENGVVIPGFYGSLPDGIIKTFSRGGSDVTGAIIARGVGASIYENWTDVNGFMVTDPRIVDKPKTIDVLSYEELRELSYMGASVLHPDSIFPVKYNMIPINIRNTFEPDNKGTMILGSTEGYTSSPITGIAGKKGNTTILIKKAMMNSEVGFGRKVLSVLEHLDINFEHIPTGIDTMSLVIANVDLEDGKEQKVVEALKAKVSPDSITVFHNLALVAIVGHGMAQRLGTAAKIFTALFEAKVNVRMIDQGSSEMNIIVGVEEDYYNAAIKAIYHAFF